MDLLEALKSRILIGDGAMGTMLQAYGIGRCSEDFNLSHPDEVLKIHKAYVDAGADLLQTNTYGANSVKLARYGSENEVALINTKAVELARQAAGPETFVVGTIGGIRGFSKYSLPLTEIVRSFREQLLCLLSGPIDGLILETYYDLEELKAVLAVARRETTLPVITHVTMHEPGVLQDGTTLAAALSALEDEGADVVGTNCRLGPYHMLQALASVPLPGRAFLSAYPNASLPDYQDGTFTYGGQPETESDYFQKCAVAFRNEGVRLLGGCCGTRPQHIRAFAQGIRNLKPLAEKTPKPAEKALEWIPSLSVSPIREKISQGRSIIVELDSPRHLDTSVFFQGAQALKEAGIDAITLADNSMATPQISNAAAASLIQRRFDLQPIVHITCRDRNLIGLQSHIMGLHALGLNEVLAVTGDPAKIGDLPGATSVYDLSSFDLIRLIKQFNQGLSYSGKPLKQKADFHIAAAFNPNAANLDKAVERLEKKIACGADYFLTQPVYDPKQIRIIREATRHLSAPFYIGVMPLTSAKNAEFLHNEVPGIRLTGETLARMERTSGDPEKARREGIEIAKELIDAILEYFPGVYLITPFYHYGMTVELTRYIQAQTKSVTR